MLKKLYSTLLVAIFTVNSCYANNTDDVLTEISQVYDIVGQFCGGISDKISSVSGVSKINTGITAVGTVAAGGALYAGLKKEKLDTEVAELAKKLCADGYCDPAKIESMSNEDFFREVVPTLVDIFTIQSQIEKSQLKQQIQDGIAESKRLGNWRTGLLAGTVGTNLASAIISGLNKDQSDLIQQITACNTAVAKLRNLYADALQSGINPIENPIMQTFEKTTKRCGTLSVSDAEKIEKRMTVVMGTSIAGTVIGAVGTGTSIAANTDSVRQDSTADGQKKEKTLNTISNVAAGANIATGLVETGFNISLISLTKDLLRSAQECEATL